MSGIRLNYHIDVATPVHAMRELAQADRELLLSDMAELVVAETQLNFENEQRPDATDWPASQRAEMTGDKTLQHHGHLRDSITYQIDGAAMRAEIGSNLQYAAIHQFGGQAGRNQAVTIPERAYLGITPAMQIEMGDMAIAFFDEVLGRVN